MTSRITASCCFFVAFSFSCAEPPAAEGEGEEGEGEGEGEEGEGEEGEGEAAEGEGEADAFSFLRFNEVGCEGTDFVELINAGTTPIELDTLVVTDDPDDLRAGNALDGVLEPGALLLITPRFGLRCDESVFVMPNNGVLVPVESHTLAGPTSAGTWGRLPDGTGEFVITNPTPGAPNAAYVDPAEVLFQPFAAPLRIDLTISAEAEAAIRNGATEYEYVEGTFQLSGPEITDAPINVGLRKKGKVGSRRSFDQKMAWKVDFDRFDVDQRYRTLAKLNLNNMVQDPSTIHEYMAYTVLADAGLPTPRLGYANVFVNGVEFGTYLMLEAFDDDVYLERRLPTDLVALFEGGLTEAACCDFADIQPNEIGRFEHDKGDEDLGRAALQELSTRLDVAASADIFTSLDSILDWDQVLTTMAVEEVIGHWDGYQVSPNNFYLHLSGDNQWRLIASGVDQTFGNEGRVDVVFNGNGKLFRRCREDATCATLYREKLTEAVARADALLAGTFEQDVTTLAQLHVDTFSTARLERSLDEVMGRKDNAFAYFRDRLRIVKQAIACDGLERNADCTVDVGEGLIEGSCGDFEGGFGCR